MEWFKNRSTLVKLGLFDLVVVIAIGAVAYLALGLARNTNESLEELYVQDIAASKAATTVYADLSKAATSFHHALLATTPERKAKFKNDYESLSAKALSGLAEAEQKATDADDKQALRGARTAVEEWQVLVRRSMEEADLAFNQGVIHMHARIKVRLPKHRRLDVRLGLPFQSGPVKGEFAFVTQNAQDPYSEFRADYVFKRRTFATLSLEF